MNNSFSYVYHFRMNKTIQIEPEKFVCPHCGKASAETLYLKCESGNIHEAFTLCPNCKELIELSKLKREKEYDTRKRNK